MFTLGHLSDSHATPLKGAPLSAFFNKRFFGWLSWNISRKRHYRPEVLESVVNDLAAQAPDHVAVTGDLTNVALEQEFVQAAGWLRRLGDPDRVSLVPGNHDAYVSVSAQRSWGYWAEFMTSDGAQALRGAKTAGRRIGFPTVRVRGEVGLVGVCTAQPTPAFQASGAVGAEQLGRLEAELRELRELRLCRVVMMHHPPVDDGTKPRRRLRDSGAFRAMLERVGADLVVCGHRHLTTMVSVPGLGAKIPVVGVRSASYLGANERKRAQYHVYGIERSTGSGGSTTAPRYRIHLSTRGYDPKRGRVVPEGEQVLYP